MKIGFWNVQRLGKGTPDAAKELVANVLEDFFKNNDVKLFVLCEVTSDTEIVGTRTSSQQLEISKIAVKNRKYKQFKRAQLGYAFVSEGLGDLDPVIIDIPNHDEVFGFKSDRLGNVFKTVSKRLVLGFDQPFNGVQVYFYHANAVGHLATDLVIWVAEALRQRKKGKPFVLVGDLNCMPMDLQNRLYHYDTLLDARRSVSKKLEVCFSGFTHNATVEASKTLDYAINGGSALTVRTWSGKRRHSTDSNSYTDFPDHFPITIDVS
jgi:hypothetical protein